MFSPLYAVWLHCHFNAGASLHQQQGCSRIGLHHRLIIHLTSPLAGQQIGKALLDQVGRLECLTSASRLREADEVQLQNNISTSSSVFLNAISASSSPS